MNPTELYLWLGGGAFAILIAAMIITLQRMSVSLQQQKQAADATRERLLEAIAALTAGHQHGADESARTRELLLSQLNTSREQTQDNLRNLGERFGDLRSGVERRVGEMQSQVLEKLLSGTQAMSKDLSAALSQNSDTLGKRVEQLTEATDKRLREISGQVDQRLQSGFEKTTQTFTEVVKRLALIDEAQKKITDLSSDVVSLQEILADKRARGAFGEVQLESLVKNVLPEQYVSMQHTLPGGSRVDCLIHLPEPTGDVCIDAKFPLENYQRMVDHAVPDAERADAQKKFRADIKKHIGDIASKYVLPEVTAAGAIMFLPAESIFAELHSQYPELVREAQERNVWICSPSTLVAVLTTARAVLRDDALRQQAHLIRNYIIELNREFDRFRERMDKLARNIRLAHEETEKVNTTAKKISKRFASIEQAHFEDETLPDAGPAQDESASVPADDTDDDGLEGPQELTH